VMMFSSEPVASGLVNSLARPGGNVTGLSTVRRSSTPSGSKCLRKSCRKSPAWRCCGPRYIPRTSMS
jgi:hypothetical protein